MKKSEIAHIIDSITPRLFGLAYAMVGEELSAEQLVIDAYTVFVVGEKDYLASLSYDSTIKKERVGMKKYFSRSMYQEIYGLAVKRFSQNKHTNENLEYGQFFELEIKKRAVVYLKEVQGLSVKDLQEVFVLQRHEVIECIYHTQDQLLSDINEVTAHGY